MGSGPLWPAWAIYGLMGVAGAVGALLTRGRVWSSDEPPWLCSRADLSFGLGLVLAVVLAVGTVALSRWLVERTAWAKELHVALRSTLAGITPRRILLLSALSAVSEELLFRAALQPSLGLVGTSLLFGLVHVSPRGTYCGWSLWAAFMGLSFGILFEASGTLLAPVLAHALINHENMHYISNYDPAPLDMDRLAQARTRVPR